MKRLNTKAKLSSRNHLMIIFSFYLIFFILSHAFSKSTPHDVIAQTFKFPIEIETYKGPNFLPIPSSRNQVIPDYAVLKFCHTIPPRDPNLTVILDKYSLIRLNPLPSTYALDSFYSIFELQNIFVSGSQMVFNQEKIVYYKDHFIDRFGKYVGHYNQVLAASHKFITTYGHIIFDLLCTVEAFPPKLAASSHILVGDVSDYQVDLVKLLFNTSKIIRTESPFDYIHCNRLYSLYPFPYETNSPPLIMRIRDMFVRFYGLSKNKANTVLVVSRQEKIRRIPNIDEVVDECKIMFPGRNVTIFGKPPSKLEETARMFNAAMLVIGLRGSGLTNIVFMQPGTVLCEIQVENVDYFFIRLTPSLGLKHIMGRDRRIPWRDPNNHPLSLVVVRSVLSEGKKYLAEKGLI